MTSWPPPGPGPFPPTCSPPPRPQPHGPPAQTHRPPHAGGPPMRSHAPRGPHARPPFVDTRYMARGPGPGPRFGPPPSPTDYPWGPNHDNFQESTHDGTMMPGEPFGGFHHQPWGRGRGGRGTFRGNYFRGHPNSMKRAHQDSHNFNKNQHSKTKKAKTAKEKPPADKCPFYCSNCDKGYNQEEMYQTHLSTHVQCGEDGCPYVAAQRLVELHREMQHQGGMAKKIWQLESKEDIEKWRQERRRNFPTKENVEKKEAALQEKIDRGEVLETKNFGKFGRHKQSRLERGRGRRMRGHRRERQHENGPSQSHAGETTQQTQATTNDLRQVDPNVKISAKTTEVQQHDGKEDPLSMVLDAEVSPSNCGAKESVSKDESLTYKESAASTAKSAASTAKSVTSLVKKTGALGSLMVAYDDSSSEEELEDGEIVDSDKDHLAPATEQLTNKPETLQVASDVNELNGMSSQTGQSLFPSKDLPVEKPLNPTASPKNKKRKNRAAKKKQKKKFAKPTEPVRESVKPEPVRGKVETCPVPKRQLSLLEKLLAKEIRHERNVVLQCVRYIVRHNFFGLRKNGTAEEDAMLNNNNNKKSDDSDNSGNTTNNIDSSHSDSDNHGNRIDSDSSSDGDNSDNRSDTKNKNDDGDNCDNTKNESDSNDSDNSSDTENSNDSDDISDSDDSSDNDSNE